MPQVSSPSMHPILHIPEILDEIFYHTSRHTQVVAALVCSIWFERSIPFIWARVELNDALNVLSPVDSRSGTFRQFLSPNAWQRFFLYSHHVRHLECSDIKYAALTQAALWRPRGTDLFSSKLVVLDWKGDADHLDCLHPLLSSTLRILFIFLDEVDDPDMVDDLCKTIAFRSPCLRAFELNIPCMRRDDDILQISNSFSELVSLLPGLISISIPIYFMTPELFATLSRLRWLEDVLLSYSLNMDYVEKHLDRKMIKAIDESEENLPFSSLFYLVVNDSLENQNFTITKAFGQGIQLCSLAILSCSPRCDNSDQVIALMESVPIVCPNLQSISISGKNCPGARLPWQVIEALLQCLDLHTLKVSQCTVDMELDNLITVATDRFFWTNIVLPSTEPFSYQALVTLAENCPYLSELGLRLSTAAEFPVPPPNVWFSSLNTLRVGASAVASPADTVIFLNTIICANSLKVEATGKHAQAWADIEKLINAVDGTARVRLLKEEIASLQESQALERTLHSISTQTVEFESK